MAFDVVTFGSAVVDVFVDTNLPEKKGSMCYPVGEKILLKDLRFDVGGGGTNTAVAFSRLGLRTGFIGKVGDDENGMRILDMLKKEKINFLGGKDNNGMTGYSVILDSKLDNRTILTYKGVNNFVSEKDFKKFRTRWLYLSSLLGKSFVTQKRLVERVFSRGGKVAFNPSSYLIKENLKDIKKILSMTEVLVLNKEEAEMIVGKKKDLLVSLAEYGPKIVVVTDKNKKIIAYDSYEDKKYSLMPHKIKVVERTGAGDAFASGFVAGRIVKKNVMDCLRMGLRESESVIKHFGAKNNLLRLRLK